jgi:hypothetical protein
MEDCTNAPDQFVGPKDAPTHVGVSIYRRHLIELSSSRNLSPPVTQNAVCQPDCFDTHLRTAKLAERERYLVTPKESPVGELPYALSLEVEDHQ